MIYEKSNQISGNWIKGRDIVSGVKAKLVTETTHQQSQFIDDKGNYKNQDVAKIRFEGNENIYNISVNKPTIDGLVEAFGKDSKEWVNKVLTVETENVRIGGRKVTAVYLIPEGFERVDNEQGYTKIVRKGEAPEGMTPRDNEFDQIPF